MKKFLHEFNHYSDGTVEDNGWWEIQGNKVVNIVGGFHYYEQKADDIIVEADGFTKLDWSCLINNKKPYGWIDLNGEFFGCNYMEHYLLAELYFKASERELEDCGFVKVYRSYNGTLQYYVSKYLNEKQEKTLLERGIKL